MKKIITLLFFTCFFATSFAQYGQHPYGQSNKAQYAYSSNREGFFSAKERDIQIFKINQDFKYNVQSIQMNRYMTRHQKRMAIQRAENEKGAKIAMVNRKFDSQLHNVYGRR